MPWAVWFRKTRWLFPISLAIMVLVMRNVQPVGDIVPGWRVNWGWMLGVWNGGTMLLSPFLASVAAMVMIRDWPQSMREHAATLPRGGTGSLHVLVVLYGQALAAMVVALIIGSVLCLAQGAPLDSATLPWQLLTGPAALFASVLLGMVVGTLLGDLIVIPLLGFGVFMAHQIFFWESYPELFTTEVPTWFYEDARPIAAHLMATVGLNLVVGAGLGCLLQWLTALPRMRRPLLLIGSAVCLAAAFAIFLPWVFSEDVGTYEYFK